MKTLNLFETNEVIKISKFAGGECHVKLLQEYTEQDAVRINTRLNSSDDLMVLMLTVDALRRMQVKRIEAFIPYVPYARQDRVMVPGEPLSIKVFASVINGLGLDKVIVFDAHSDVAPALLDNCKNVPNYEMAAYFLKELKLTDYILVSPDLGAYKKVDKLAAQVGYKNNIAAGIKVRDLATGQIIKSDVIADDLSGKSCIVVDDICDGGRTFMEIAKSLKEKGAGKLYLIVSHGIFSHNALERLQEAGYENVCSSDSVAGREENEFYKQFNLFEK
jgi:ribose-phosphate pyrophosphokinase